MKIGIISDIHANLAAFQAVLRTLKQERCVKVLCAGDVVGYGPSPLECIELVQKERILCVQGNHDFWIARNGRDYGISSHARLALEWTADVLPQDAVRWLAGLPRKLDYGGFEVVHSSCALRPRWAYVLSEKLLHINFLMQESPYAFHGHTHMPLLGVHTRGKRPRFRQLQPTMVLEPGARYLINVGSVGQPRDKNPLAACGVFETSTRTFHLIRAPYDISHTQKLMREAGLPELLINRLAEGR